MAKEKQTEETPGQPTPGTNDPKEAITTPGEVEESNDEKIDQDYPGYPHHPAQDDILDPKNNSGRVEVDIENLTRGHAIDPGHLKSIEGVSPVAGITSQEIPGENEEDIGIVPGTEADVTAEDLLILGDRDADMDEGEDEELAARGWKPKSGADLDVPDGNLHEEEGDTREQGDEENSYYSLGGDSKDSLEENSDARL